MLGSEWALREAVLNLERSYRVVGVLEDLEATLAVLEAEVPRFFRGVLLNKLLRAWKKGRNIHLYFGADSAWEKGTKMLYVLKFRS